MTAHATSAPECSEKAVHSFESISFAFACLLILMGAVTCSGWVLNIPAIIGFVPNSPGMAPNTGVVLLLCGLSLILQWRAKTRLLKNVGLLLAIVGFSVSFTTLAEYSLGRNLGVDDLFIRVSALPLEPKRPAPEGALGLLFGTAALLFYSFPRRIQLTHFFSLMTGALALLALLGYSIGEPVLYSAISGEHAIGMAFHTALAFLILTLALLGSRPTLGFMSLLVSESSGGIVARRLLTTTLAIVPILGILLLAARAVGLPNSFEDTFAIVSTIAIFGTLTWIVARKLRESEREAREAEMRLRQLVEQASDGIFVADLSGRYTDVNSSGAKLLGYAREEIIGKTITDLIAPEDVRRLEESRTILLEPGVAQVAEWKLRKKSGEFLPVEVSAKILPDGRWQGFVRDISERKRIQSELQRLREEWTSVIAHDLRQPLGTVSLCTQLLSRLHGEDTSGPEGKIVRRLAMAAGSMQRMIEDLLDFSRIEAKQLKLEVREIDLSSLVREFLEGMGYGAPESPLRLEADPQIPKIHADPVRVEQILGNLVSNAIKYRAPGTEILVRVRDQGSEASVSVTNSGPGIEPDELPHLFSRFARTEESKKAGIPGLGLGLYICRGLVEAHGGRIRAESVPGQTTTFSFTIPKAQPLASAA